MYSAIDNHLVTAWPIFKSMWQSRVEIKHYFIAYFDIITVFEVLLRAGSYMQALAHKYQISPSLMGDTMLRTW